MPIRDVEAQNASLANDYGPTHGPNSPDSHDLALFNGDPMVVDPSDDPGVEVTGPGYGRGVIDMADWSVPSGGSILATGAMPTPTGEWDEGTHWALFDGDTMWDTGALQEPVNVTGAGDPPLVNVQIFHPDSLTDDL